MDALLAKIGWSILSSLLTEAFGKAILCHTIYFAAKKWKLDYLMQVARDMAKAENVDLPA